ncbi:hypothetical protein AB1Y20_013286 [Prymnesium parvum]|uniref:Methyltransferase domain-containing protein n=1 Tax=Prymnesium parvum TaxID=97485 RepID=A0AB34IMX2_PRYPA
MAVVALLSLALHHPFPPAPRRALVHSLARGFGSPAPPSSPTPTLDADAAALLEEARGDVDRARTNYVGYTLAFLQDADPELYAKLKQDPSRPECHEALVELTWDAIAAFLPVTHSPTPTPAAARKLTAIARAACDGSAAAPRVLDVGCGNGLLLPFLVASGMGAAEYRGVDLSSRMIDAATKAHGRLGARFEAVSFSKACEGEERYDAVVFNGALQFFADVEGTLAQAASVLATDATARIVISHLNGAEFVRKEAKDNPTTVRSTMPSLETLEVVASGLGLQVVIPSFFGSEVQEIEKGLEDFYLVVLRRVGDNDDNERVEHD